MNDEKDGNGIVWEEPPRPQKGVGSAKELRPFYDALQANPGKWAIYPRVLARRGVGSYTRRHPGFQFCTRTIPGEGVKVYVSYIGPNGEYKS